MFDYLVVGHLTVDLLEDGAARTGGTALYAALTAYQLGARVAILTAAAPDIDRTMLPSDIKVMLRPARVSTTFRNTYHDNVRTQFMYHRAPPLTKDDIAAALPAHVVHLGPVADETPHDMARLAPGSFVGLTAQGLLRYLSPEQQVFTDPALLRRLPLRGVDAMVLSEEDVTFDEDSVVAATAQVPIVALTRAERGATLWLSGSRYEIAAYRANVVDPTGAGDVFATAFFLALQAGVDPLAAARRACAAASCVIEGVGVETLPTPAMVAARMERGE
jgi:sugar/nucleoside kinase (ribokinase family)